MLKTGEKNNAYVAKNGGTSEKRKTYQREMEFRPFYLFINGRS